ncbi:MAG: hypothetical protein H6Q63_111, partial [Firmicutes bacterium]|nr:hypothetical protein [Bacillota bacterium]
KFRITNSHDQIIHGVIAGFAGGIAESVFAYTTKMLNFTDRIFMDYGEVLILGQHKGGLLLGLIAHLVNASFFGIIFSYIMKFGKKKYYVLKGIGLGLIIWLFSLGMATLFKLPLFEKIESNVGYVLFIGSIIYGSVMSSIYRYLDKKLQNDLGTLEGFR